MLVSKEEKYLRQEFSSEAEIETVVQDFAEFLFGTGILFLPKKKISTVGGTGTIPDGFVINIQTKEWYVVEAELGAHGTWQHIAPQISKQLTAIDNLESKENILKLAMEQLKSDENSRAIMTDFKIEKIDYQAEIHSILKNSPIIALPIDFIPKDLKSWATTLKYQVKIWLIEKLVSISDENKVFYSIPEEFKPTISSVVSKDQVRMTSSQGTPQYQKILETGKVKIGDQIFLEYGVKGQKKKKYFGIIKEAGVEIDGKQYSLSYGAVVCMKKSGSQRDTANGWTMWKNMDGVLLDTLYLEAVEAAPDDGQAT